MTDPGAGPKRKIPPAPRSPAVGAAAETIIRSGVPASGGLASGPAHLAGPVEETAAEDRVLRAGEETREVRRFRLAVRRSLDEINALRECLLGDPSDPGLKILDAHRMLLDDQEFQQRIIEGIRVRRRPATTALREVVNEVIRPLEAAGSEYFRARSADLADIRRRVARHLEGTPATARPVPPGAVVVAAELSPSEATSFDPEVVRALVTDHGGPTSHAAILARSRGLPAVVGLVDFSSHVHEGDRVLVDGHRGVVVLRPGPEELRDFEARRRREVRRVRLRGERGAGPAVTLDGHPVTLLANIETAADAPNVVRTEAQGIGLYRTEYFYLLGPHLPDEEGQYRAYRKVVQALKPRPVVIRTLDAGGDKFAAYLGTPREMNPFLGVRGIRFSLGHPDIFRVQLRAILRASAHGDVRLLYPMVSSVEEVRCANAMADEAAADLRREGIAIAARVDRGVMIEVPAAVGIADFLAREADFFSIGSNDLIQYMLAVDRSNEKLASMYDPFHPAVLRALSYTIDVARRAGIPVSSCGEMSGSPAGAAVLLGLGCSMLSMSPFQLDEVKNLVRQVSLVDLRRLAEEALRKATTEEVHAAVGAALGHLIDTNGNRSAPPKGGAAPHGGTPGGRGFRPEGARR
jgi:phosphoenolpyruvate-protein phosphotransferase (PTS system enzyme I)